MIVACHRCGRSFNKTQRLNGRRNYCSVECCNLDQRTEVRSPEMSSDGWRVFAVCGTAILVDEADVAHLSEHRWRLTNTNYAFASIRGKSVYMHRLIADAQPDQQIDHVNGDSLDNRRANLRIAENWQNAANATRGANSTGFRGVKRHRQKWRASISKEWHRVSLGSFDTAEAAARAYDDAARELHGAFAIVNFPRDGERAATSRSR